MEEEPQLEEEESTATLAQEIAKETRALNDLLSAYASKADVERQLRAERKKTQNAIKERDRSRTVTLVVVVVAVIVSVGISLWALGVSHSASHSASVANAAAAKANDAQARADDNDERQQQVSCTDANKNRAALVSLFDYIDALASERAAATGTPVDKSTEDLIQFGRATFAPRDCVAEAAARHHTFIPTTTTQPGG